MREPKVGYYVEIPVSRVEEAGKALDGVGIYFHVTRSILNVENVNPEADPGAPIFRGCDLFNTVLAVNRYLDRERMEPPRVREDTENWTPERAWEFMEMAGRWFAWEGFNVRDHHWEFTPGGWPRVVQDYPLVFRQGRE